MKMKILKPLFIVIIALIVGSCSKNIHKHNIHINTPIPQEQLKADVDYAYRKLQKLHPRLDWYINKDDLEQKFDSLKAAIDTSMISNEFFFMLSPVVSSIRQGHIGLYPLTPKATKKESKELNRKGPVPLSLLNYEFFNNKLYIVKTQSPYSCIQVGSEIIAINSIKPQEITNRFGNTLASDGFITTYNKYRFATQFPYFFHVYSGERDSVQLTLRHNDTISHVNLVRGQNGCANTKVIAKQKDEKDINAPSKAEKANHKKEMLEEKRKRKYQGYNPQTKNYSKNLTFADPDSSIAILYINDFIRGEASKFYRNSFKILKEQNVKNLIIDLRNNPGGKISEISILYSYLTDTTFSITNRIETTSLTSYLIGSYTKSTPKFFYFLDFTIGLPFRFRELARMRKKDNKFYYSFRESKRKLPNKDRFEGNLYVITNGGTFSASSIISANLKATQRGVFVGEETGGAFNGFVAGRMPTFLLPHSKLPLRFGLGVIEPFNKSDINGRGIMPDIEIIPTIDDRIKGTDPELNWIMADIDKRRVNL
jgi:C-terminal processing protease CtpA/Prc